MTSTNWGPLPPLVCKFMQPVLLLLQNVGLPSNHTMQMSYKHPPLREWMGASRLNGHRPAGCESLPSVGAVIGHSGLWPPKGSRKREVQLRHVGVTLLSRPKSEVQLHHVGPWSLYFLDSDVGISYHGKTWCSNPNPKP